MKPAAPDPEIIGWLWSEEGLAWAKVEIKRVRHGGGVFAEVKNDHECGTAQYCLFGCASVYNDEQIRQEIDRYGIGGVPQEWKQRFRRSG